MRLAILDAAEVLIRRHGIDRTRLVDVAKSVGVNHAMLYRHFDDKAGLIDAVSQRWLTHLHDRLALIVSGEGPATSRLKDWFLTLHRSMRDKCISDPELFNCFALATRDGRAFAASHTAAIRWQLAKIVTAAVQAGEIDDGDPLEITVLLFEATSGFHQPGAGLEADGREPLLIALLDILLAGLGKPVVTR